MPNSQGKKRKQSRLAFGMWQQNVAFNERRPYSCLYLLSVQFCSTLSGTRLNTVCVCDTTAIQINDESSVSLQLAAVEALVTCWPSLDDSYSEIVSVSCRGRQDSWASPEDRRWKLIPDDECRLESHLSWNAFSVHFLSEMKWCDGVMRACLPFLCDLPLKSLCIPPSWVITVLYL